MTVVARVAAGYVSQVFACRNDSIVTAAAGTDDLGVIDGQHRRKDVGGMAVFTDIRRSNVPAILANCFRTVVTTNAVAGNIQVIKICRQPTHGAMTVIAGIAARDMCQVFAEGNDAVVAG